MSSLGEATAITLHQNRDSQGFGELHRDALEAGEVGNEAGVTLTIAYLVLFIQLFVPHPLRDLMLHRPRPLESHHVPLARLPGRRFFPVGGTGLFCTGVSCEVAPA